MSASLSQLIPEFEPIARDFVTAVGQYGLQPRVTSTLRSYPEQKRLYNRYLAGQSQYPAAPPGTSAHEFGYAFDMVVSPMEYLPLLGDAWKQLGGVWHAEDPIHFEYPGFVAPPPTELPNQLGAVGDVIRSVAEWYANLPWYVSLFLPVKYATEERQVTWEKFKEITGI